MYTLSVSADRRYQLQSEEANRRIDALLEQLRVPASTWRLYGEMLTAVLKMLEDGAGVADLKITAAALKEMRYGYKVFAPYRHVRKVTVFGSARTSADHAVSRQAYEFGKRMADGGFMVMTGAGSGVMGSAQHGAGRERSFGLNIRLPFEQDPNPWIANDPKLISFKYFFTRKLFLVREAQAMAFLPGGFGTCDEAFEAMTLIQTGKAAILPLVLLDAPGGTYWKKVVAFMREEMLLHGMISPEDLELFHLTDDVEEAASEIERFYRVYHSQRHLGDKLLLRLQRPLPEPVLWEIGSQFADVLSGPVEQTAGPVKGEDDELPDLPRLVLRFNRLRIHRLRQLLDLINQS
jgi:uncharacterized protein (TIGR00730 family)